MTNLPVFASHNQVNRDVTVPFTSDLNLIGAYLVNIKGSIEVWSDYTKSAKEVVDNAYTFTIFMEPCVIVNYAPDQVMPDMFYNIRAPALINQGPYSFF